MTRPQGILSELGSLDTFGAGIEQKPVGELESPPHKFYRTVPVRVDGDDRLYGAGRDVFFRAEVEVFNGFGDAESISEALLVGFAAIAATYDLSVRCWSRETTVTRSGIILPSMNGQ